MEKINYAAELNDEQLSVVMNGEGYCLVLAGAGSGKTRTLVYRVARLIEQGINPKEILLLTFTIKAAKEMTSRVEGLLDIPAGGLWGGTFHHVANRILRKFAPRIGYPQNFVIMDNEDSKALFAQCIRDVNEGPIKGFPTAGFFNTIKGLAANRITNWQVLMGDYPQYNEFFYKIKEVFAQYKQRKIDGNLMDFDDLIFYLYRLLSEYEDVRLKYSRQFKYVMVDEYQDTSLLQAKIVELFSSCHKNLLVVGDDAQSIYSFRGATVENILDFPKQYPGAKVFHLSKNYRSTPQVVYLANNSIQNNVRGFQKALKAVYEKEGELPLVARVSTAEEEARFIAGHIEEFLEEGIAPNSIAVLFRSSYHCAKLELSLAGRGVPYIMRGGIRFFEQAHIKDVLAYLRLLYNPKDYLAWQRVLCMYPGVGPQTARKLFTLLGRIEFGSLLEQAKSIKRIPKKAKSAIETVAGVFAQIKDIPLYEACRTILESGYVEYLSQNFDDASSRQEDLVFLLDFLRGYNDLESLFSDIGITENFRGERNAPASDSIVLSTVHQAKGLEWDVVFVMGVVDGQFPHSKSIKEELAIEEERRLFYVALTRAKKFLIITSPAMGFDYRAGGYLERRSSFIDELPRDGYQDFSPAGTNSGFSFY